MPISEMLLLSSAGGRFLAQTVLSIRYFLPSAVPWADPIGKGRPSWDGDMTEEDL